MPIHTLAVSLKTYTRRRPAGLSAEPRVPARRARRRGAACFVVHQHAATRLHYDLRLEFDGVLKCWAVARGPSYRPSDRRLAVQVEDHPLDYADFEGVIPAGSYGAGPTLVWDCGTWQAQGDVRAGLRQGKLHFTLQGAKLRGEWALVRTAQSATSWLLFKVRDGVTYPGDVVREQPHSVRCNLTLPQLARAGSAPRPQPPPRAVAPQLATLADRVPKGEGWGFEVKLDGYRCMATLAPEKICMRSRNGHDWTRKFGPVPAALTLLPCRHALLDGEVVVPGEAGPSSFAALQAALRSRDASALIYYIFDLLYIDGADLRAQPLYLRQARLRQLLLGVPAEGAVRLCASVQEDGTALLAAAQRMGLEGLVAKEQRAPYLSGRQQSWRKLKLRRQQELVVVGYTQAPHGLGALELATYNAQGKLEAAGRVGTGFTAAIARELLRGLQPLHRRTAPHGKQVAGVQWVRPQLVVEVAFAEWTPTGQLRQASLVEIRRDKAAKSVRRERAAALPATSNPRPHGVTITHASRVVYPHMGLTKQAVCDYYEAVAPQMLPLLQGRPLTLLRCPQGQQETCFWQRHATGPAAAQLGDDKQAPLVVRHAADLMQWVQLGVLEFHVGGCQVRAPLRPNLMVIDLDPDPQVAPQQLIDAALFVREALHYVGLVSFLRLTGGKGLHVVVPLSGSSSWEAVYAFSHGLALRMQKIAPRLYTASQRKADRSKKIYIDVLRNKRGASAVATYSTRAHPEATVAHPLRWEALQVATLRQRLTLVDLLQASVRQALAAAWADFVPTRQRLLQSMVRQMSAPP